MKKKILSICLVVCLAATAIAGASLAYFTDDDIQTNTFTAGDVKIDLWEDFSDNTGNPATLIPAVIYDEEGNLVKGTGSDQEYTVNNKVEKEVYVTNIGSEEAYVRVQIAIPSLLCRTNTDGKLNYEVNGSPVEWSRSYADGRALLDTKLDELTTVEGKWSWAKETAGANFNGVSDWNMYTTTIGGHGYTVYVVTYETALKNGESTCEAIDYVYMNSSADNADVAEAKNVLGETWNYYVVAEGVQVDGFETAGPHAALDAAFGEPGTYDVDWAAAAEGKTFENALGLGGVN